MTSTQAAVAAGSHVIGIDLGGSYVRALLRDAGGRELAEASEPTPDRGVLEAIAEHCRRLARGAGVPWERVSAVGVGMPGVADRRTGRVRLAPNVPPFGDVDVPGALHAALGRPVAVDNDVNMATRAEHRHGLGMGSDDFVFIAVGTGIGMGVVAGGRLVRGASGAAGEIAGLPIGTDPLDPANQVRGPLEEAVSGIGLAHAYARRIGTGVARAGELDLFAAAAGGDRDAAELVAEQALSLALAVVAVRAVLDPALVVLGGGIGSRPDVLGRVRERIGDLTSRPIRLETSRLGERAGVIGAADLAAEPPAGHDGS